MPTYDYYCPSNSKTIEVLHSMSRTVETWGELCELADQPTGKTPSDAPVEKLVTAGVMLSGGSCKPGCC
ncbi:MAG: zinc ribbon domain-containing protein [Acidobacteriota bacterium]